MAALLIVLAGTGAGGAAWITGRLPFGEGAEPSQPTPDARAWGGEPESTIAGEHAGGLPVGAGTDSSTPVGANALQSEGAGAAPSPRPMPEPTSRAAVLLDRPTLPGVPRQLSQPGCCAGAWWSSDSGTLLFLDRPPGSASTGIYGIPLWPPGAEARMVDPWIGVPTGAPRIRVRSAGDHSILRNLDNGEEWPLPTGGRPLRLSPDGSRAVWWDSWGGRQDIDSLVKITTADIYGREVRHLTALWGAAVVGFTRDSRGIIATGRPFKERPLTALVRLDTETSELHEMARGEWLSGALPSPDGRWVAYMVSLDTQHPERNGVWIAGTEDGAPDAARKLPFEGAYRWRDGARLVVVPMEPNAPAASVWEIDARTMETRLLVGPDAGIRIANNDWSVSPDGGTMAYLDLTERGVWLIDLP